MTGYIDCACRDCFNAAIGLPGDFCLDCEESGCELDRECSAPGAYASAEEDERCSFHQNGGQGPCAVCEDQ